MHQEEIELLDAELRHRVDAALAHQLRAVVALPQLGRDPQLVTRADALGERLRNRPSHFVFVHVNPRLVDVAVAARQRRLRARVHLAGFGQPRAVSDLRHLVERAGSLSVGTVSVVPATAASEHAVHDDGSKAVANDARRRARSEV